MIITAVLLYVRCYLLIIVSYNAIDDQPAAGYINCLSTLKRSSVAKYKSPVQDPNSDKWPADSVNSVVRTERAETKRISGNILFRNRIVVLTFECSKGKSISVKQIQWTKSRQTVRRTAMACRWMETEVQSAKWSMERQMERQFCMEVRRLGSSKCTCREVQKRRVGNSNCWGIKFVCF